MLSVSALFGALEEQAEHCSEGRNAYLHVRMERIDVYVVKVYAVSDTGNIKCIT
jgi:hypothetical protein